MRSLTQEPVASTDGSSSEPKEGKARGLASTAIREGGSSVRGASDPDRVVCRHPECASRAGQFEEQKMHGAAGRARATVQVWVTSGYLRRLASEQRSPKSAFGSELLDCVANECKGGAFDPTQEVEKPF